MSIETLPLNALHAHPLNSNVMQPMLLVKLKQHIAQTDRYPPIIVRPHPQIADEYEILDGHHRVQVLRDMDRTTAQCVNWPVNDEQAMILLATLNRLEGADDTRKRAALISELHARPGDRRWHELLPESRSELAHLANLHTQQAPDPRPSADLRNLPVSMHFFLPAAQRDAIERKLRQHPASREQALVQLLGIEIEDQHVSTSL